MRFIKFTIMILGILSILLGLIGLMAFFKDGRDNTLIISLGFLLGGVLIPDSILAFFEDEDKEEDE